MRKSGRAKVTSIFHVIQSSSAYVCVCVCVDLCLYFVIHHGVEINSMPHNFTSVFTLNEEPEELDNGTTIRDSSPVTGKQFSSWPKCPDRLCGPPSLLFDWHRGFLPGIKAAGALC